MKKVFALSEQEKTAYKIIAPTLILLIIFVYYPSIRTLLYSFTSLNLRISSRAQFIGLRNYLQALRDNEFWVASYHTFLMIGIVLPIESAIGLGGALLLNKTFKGRGVVRVLAILPWMLPPVANGLMWGWILNGEYGALNGLLYQLGIISSYKHWLGGLPLMQVFWVCVAQAWTRYSFVMLVLLGGLQSIPSDLYGAATVDGANVFQCFRYITFPLLKPSFTIAIMVEFIMIFQMFGIILGITGGGTSGRIFNPFTKNLMVFDYELVFRRMDIGFGSTVAYFMFLFSLLIGISVIAYMYRKTK
jgi:multiple sugar transport system permease protein